MANHKKSIEARKAETAALLERLRQGIAALRNSFAWAAWLTFHAQLYRYSWSNTLLIYMQCPHASVVMGFRAWGDHGRYVRQGEKGIKILCPCFKAKDEDEDDEKSIAYFRTGAVFDISQTGGGEDIPSICRELQGDDDGLFARLRAVSPVPVRYGKTRGNGHYDCVARAIVIKKGLSPVQRAKTLAHEIAHAKLHADLSSTAQSCADKELEAESVAYIVMAHFGVKTDDYSFGYIASWKDDADKGLQQSAKRIADCARQIIDTLHTQISAEGEKAA